MPPEYTAKALQQLSLAGFEAPQKPTDRLFFAIFPDAAAAACIAQLAHHLRSEHGLKGKPLDPQRFHITLHHLGDYAGLRSDIIAAAAEAAATVTMPAFEVAFDHALSFSATPGNRPFVLRGGEGVRALSAFQRALGAAINKTRLGGGGKQYTPHVTLLYDDRAVAKRFIEPVGWTVREFVLVHSLLGQTVHVPLARWPLLAGGSMPGRASS